MRETGGIGWFLGGFGLGVLFGLAMGVLYAPRAGEETRQQLKEGMEDLGKKIRETTERVVEGVRKGLESLKERVKESKEAPSEN